MAKRDPRTEIHLDVDAGADHSTLKRPDPRPHTTDPRPRPDEPFRIAVLGDFSGRCNRGAERSGEALATLSAIRVDRDEIGPVLARLAPRLRIPTTAPELPALDVAFESLDDFHPDALYERLPLFQELRELRRLARDPSFSADAPAAADTEPPDVHSRGATSPGPASPAGATPPPPGGLLDRIVDEGGTGGESGDESGGAPGATSGGPVVGDDLHGFIQRIAAPHAVEATPARQAEVLGRIDAVIAAQLRELLHHAHFRGLESIWRGLEMLALRVETDERLQIHLVDLTRDELEAELERDARGEPTGFRRLLRDPARTPGEVPWTVLIGCYAFRPGQARLLARMGAAAREAGAPFIARAAPELAGVPGFEGRPDPSDWTPLADREWNALRHSGEARWIGLALPRFLLRLPYGAEGVATDVVELEEADSPPHHDDYLWGNPAIACAILLARSFTEAGWEMRPEQNLQLDRLPLHIAEGPTGALAQPCAESLMTDDAAARLLDLGFMPLASFRDQDRVRLVRFQSIAEPLAALSGRWRRP